jgi:hypothetical protein
MKKALFIFLFLLLVNVSSACCGAGQTRVLWHGNHLDVILQIE